MCRMRPESQGFHNRYQKYEDNLQMLTFVWIHIRWLSVLKPIRIPALPQDQHPGEYTSIKSLFTTLSKLDLIPFNFKLHSGYTIK